MKNKIKVMLAGLLAIPALAFGVTAVLPGAAFAACDNASTIANSGSISTGLNCAGDSIGNNKPDSLTDVVTKAIKILLYVVGVVAVIMLIVGGIRYALSGGSGDGVKAAKNTILYAIIGLVIAILAYAIVSWIAGSLGVA